MKKEYANSMVYLAVQPAEHYFIWQLQLLLGNLNCLGVKKTNIHILFCVKTEKPTQKLEQLLHEFKDKASFFFYKDTRQTKFYTSSIRPNILKQHFKANPFLKNEILFYHDSDLLFFRLPKIEVNRGQCFVSDTRSYLDSKYIKKAGSEQLFAEMAKIVGIDTKLIEANDHNCGGAQYVLQEINSDFWEKVESDSEALFEVMKLHNFETWNKTYSTHKILRSKYNGIQAWCADMWAVFWNLLYFKHHVSIHAEMSFCWPANPKEFYGQHNILHYSGEQQSESMNFKKAEFVNYPPWYSELLPKYDKQMAGYHVVEKILARQKELSKKTNVLENTVIVFGSEGKSTIEQALMQQRYINKYLNVDTILEEQVSYKKNLFEIATKYEYIVYFMADQIVDLVFLEKQLFSFRSSKEKRLLISNSSLFKLDSLFAVSFSKSLDIKMLNENIGKCFKKEEGGYIIVIKSESLKPFPEFDFTRIKESFLKHEVAVSNQNFFQI